MSWEKLKPIEPNGYGCPCCGGAHSIAPMEMVIAVGFGSALVTKNGEEVYSDMDLDESTEYWQVIDAENEALKDDDNDWRIVIDAPLHNEVYQRQGKGEWVLVEQGVGFA